MNFITLKKAFLTVTAKPLKLLPVSIVLMLVSAGAFAQAPANDNSNQAVVLTPEATCTYVSGTLTNATHSTTGINPTCANYTSTTVDVWYKATVPAGGALTFDMQGGGVTAGGMAVYRGVTATALTLLACEATGSSNANMPQITVTGLAPNATVYVRIWSANGSTGTFGVCATIPVPPPSNDNPCAAIELTVKPTCAYDTFTNASATNTTAVTAPVCAGYLGGDVWFKVVVPAGITALAFDSQPVDMTDGGMAIYSGSSCLTASTFTALACDDNSSVNGNMPAITVGGLVPGDTVWVRFWENGNDNNGRFGLCVTLPPPPPANDEPCSAIELPVSETCTYQTFTNENATNTTTVTAPTCADYQGGDVWFKVVVPAGGALIFDSQTGVMTDGGMALYGGSCNNLISFACDDDASPNGAMPLLAVSGLNPGDTVWVRFWENGNNNNGTFGICAKIPPPAPANDNPCGAIEVTADTVCNFQTFSNESSTGSIGMEDPGCADYTGSDVWFKVVVPAGGALIFDSRQGVITDGGMAIYSGSCSNLTLIECDDDDSNNGAMPYISLTGQTPGDTLWIRFWEYGGNNNGTFDLCVKIPPPPPANDEACNAVELTVGNTCTYQTFTNESATDSQGAPDPGCANYQGGDVWFKAVVPAGGAIVFDSQVGTMTDGGLAVYSGSCGNLTLLGCDDDNGAANMPKLTLAGLTPGDTVWVRVWENGNDNNGTFGICLNVPPPPPANNLPCDAIELPVAATCNYQTFTNESATGSTGVPAPGCAGYQGGDVWFKAVVPADGAIIFDTQEGAMTDGGMAVYTGNCGNLSLVTCDDNSGAGNMPKLTIGGLNPGDTVWIRIWENGNNNNGTFGICATIPPPPPSNDNPCNAIQLTPDSTCNFQTFTNENATNTLGVPAPGCANYQGGDVWFSVVVPSGGALEFDSQTGVITDGGMAVYSGSCNNLTLLDCDDDGSNNGAMSFISLGGLTPGDTLWVRCWEYGGDNNGTFGICVTLPPPGPVNDDPCNAIELPVEANCNYQTFTNENAYNTANAPAPGCAGYAGGDVWFKAVVPAGGAITFDTQVGDITDGGMAVYSGACNNLTLLSCDDDSGPGNMPKLTVGGLNPGDTVWIRVWEAGNNNNGTFGICLTVPPPPPANDDPCGAIVLTVADTCIYQTFSNVSSYNTAIPAPPCGNYQGADVWFQVVSPAAGAVNINTIAGSVNDLAMAVYVADSCNGAMRLIACDDNGSGNPRMPYITVTGVLSGTPLYIRVWTNGGAANAGSFGICTTVPALQPATFSFACARDTSFNCSTDSNCFSLQAIIPDIHSTTDRYAINPLSSSTGGGCFNPYVFPGGDGPSTDLRIDDRYTSEILLPFTFPFFGTNYNSLVASTNGYISFDAANLATTFSHWDIVNGTTPQNLPSTFYDRALIMGPYHDLNPFYTTSPNMRIKYNITGTAPHRRWILSFYKVPLFTDFGGGCDTLIDNTHQIVLYEGTGVVEVFIFDMQNCLSWNEGRAMVGMQDYSRTRAIMAPGRRASDAPWGRRGMNESWRFVPIGGPTLFKRVELFDTSGNFLATGDTTFLDSASLKVNFRNLCSLNRLPAGLNTLLIRATYQKFDDPTAEEVGADTIQVFIPNLKVNFNVQNARCTDPTGTVTIHSLNGVPPLEFSKDSGATWQSDSVFTNLLAGSYYIKVRDAAGCARDTIVRIDSVGDLHPLYTVTNALCSGGNGTVVINAASAVPPVKYSSDGGVNYQYSNSFSLPAGSYNFHTVDTAGCSHDTTIVITQPDPIVITSVTVTPAGCGGTADGSITIAAGGGTPAYEYAVGTGSFQPSGTLTVPAGDHTVHIRDANGCTKDTVVTVGQSDPVLISLTVTAPKCFGGNDGKIQIVASGGVPAYEYSFDNGNLFGSVDSLLVAAGTFNISVRDSRGCRKDTTITVTQPQPITLTAAVTDAKCFGSADGKIKITAAGGTPGYEYSFNNQNSYSTVDSIAVTAGSYHVWIRDANGCTKDTTINITEPTAISVTAVIADAKCNGSSDGSFVLTAAGGTPAYEYSKDGGINYQPSATFSSLQAAVYSVRIRDVNGCVKDTSITVAQPATLTATADAGNANCTSVASGTVVAHAAGGTAPYLFSSDGSNYFTDSSFALPQGPVTISVKDANNCLVTAAATIGFVNDLTLQTRQDTTICGNVSVGLYTTSNGDNFSWTILSGPGTVSNTTDLSPVTSPTATTVYVITARKGTQCVLTDTAKIIVTTPPVVNAGNGAVISRGQDAQLNGAVTNAANFAWTPTTYLNNATTLSPIAVMPQQTIVYTLTATNTEGCSTSDTVTVTVLPFCVKVKNAFTPNGDGVNDMWMVYDQYDCLTNVKVQVFNRYGSRVYQSPNYRNQWDGTYNGQPLPDATYYYVIDFVMVNGVTYQVRGDVTILR